MGRRVALLLVLALASCAGPRWQRQGADADQVSADFADCNGFAQDVVRRDSQIDTDIMASRGRDWENNGTLRQHQTIIDSETGARSDAALDACMASKGYTQTK